MLLSLERVAVLALIIFELISLTAKAEGVRPDLLPIFPINFDVAIRQQTFAPDDREIGIQAGYTFLRYHDYEIRHTFQYFSIHTQDATTDQYATFLNPRWNNFIDVLDFPKNRPISRMIRHALFGPLEDRAVPYIGGLAGIVFPGPSDNPGLFYGGQVGVRFPVARGIAVDFSGQYSRFQVQFLGESQYANQWVFLSGVRF